MMPTKKTINCISNLKKMKDSDFLSRKIWLNLKEEKKLELSNKNRLIKDKNDYEDIKKGTNNPVTSIIWMKKQ